MTSDNNHSSSTANKPEEEQPAGRTLDMQNISIRTMKEDIAKDNPTEEKKGGWFDFMAKKKEGNSVAAPSAQAAPSEQAPAKQDAAGASLDKELEAFKKENEQPAEKPLAESGSAAPAETVEAPSNLPIGGEPVLNKLEDKLVGKMSGATETTPAEATTLKQAEPIIMKPDITAGDDKEEDMAIPDIQGKLREALGGETLVKEEEAELANKIKPVTDTGIAGSMIESPSNLTNGEGSGDNPFSARIEPKETEKKSLLSSVEAALNYSAPPEFSKERENQGVNAADGAEGGGPVVDLRKKVSGGPLAALLANKKMLAIGGGALGLVVVIIITLSLVLGGSKSTPITQTPPTNATQENKNTNTAAIPIKPVVQAPPAVTVKKVLTNTLEVPIETANDITVQLDKYRQGQTVSKQSQLLFQKSDDSGATFQDLMDATGIMIPRNIVTQPSAEAALVFVDFFHGQTIFGLIVPTKDNKDLTLSKLKDWESTMIIDLGDLWKGIGIDNKGAYFADSQIFPGGRFALIDKKQGLSLDYLVQNGYVLIAPGKDSMTVLKNQFTPPADNTDGAGIKWEEESSTTVSGMESNSNTNATSTSANSNDNVASETNENVNSQ